MIKYLQVKTIDMWFWGSWCLFSMTLLGFFLSTMDVAPFLHKDEFMIVDLGRIILHPHTEWSITWLTEKDKPFLFWSYLGPVFQEFSYQVLGQYGPRISSIIGAISACTVMVILLLKRGTNHTAAFALGLIFLLDPLFVQGYTIGRIDGWAMTVCLIGCFLLSDSKKKFTNQKYKIRSFSAGACGAISFFIWPSSVLLFPLLFYFLALFCINYTHSIKPLIFFSIGGITTCIIIILPIAPRLIDQFAEIVDGLQINLINGSPTIKQPFYLTQFGSFLELLRLLKFTPFLLILAVLGLAAQRKAGLLIVIFIVVIIILNTLVYVHRVQYLLPYLIVSVAGLYQEKVVFAKLKKVFLILKYQLPLALVLLWQIGFSLGFRTVLAFEDNTESNRNLVFSAAKKMIGSGDRSNVLSPFEFYYSGRALGWKMYSPYLSVGQPLSPNVMEHILPHIDYVIMHFDDVDQEFEKLFKKSDFRNGGTYYINLPSANEDANLVRIRRLFSIYSTPYGPYKLFVRRPNHIANLHNQ